MRKNRDPNIELWRCFCMFAVVMGHVLVNNCICPMEGFFWHIPGFLLISGFFGVKFSLGKIFKLVVVTYTCYWLTIPLRDWNGVGALLLPHGGWFLPFYCVLMLMSPILNAALEAAENHRMICASIIGMVCIGWIPTFSGNSHVQMMAIPGMQGNGLLLMITTYCLGAMLRKYEVAKRKSAFLWLVLFVCSVVSCVVVGLLAPKACHYLSPISLAAATFGLMYFVAIPQLPYPLGRAINFISPSMFSVYVLHECCIRHYQYSSHAGVSEAVALASVLFFGCLAIDLIRRFVMFGLTKLTQPLMRYFRRAIVGYASQNSAELNERNH